MTSRDSRINPKLKRILSLVRTSEEALKIWCEYRDELVGYTFVVAEPKGTGALHFPASIDFPHGGHLRSVFAHDNLFLINHELLDRAVQEGSSRIGCNYTVAFDANVASYLRAWHNGRSGPMVNTVQAVFHALDAGRFNWDLLPFLLERSEDILAGRDLDQIYETQLAAIWFSVCDRAHFARTGEVRLTISNDEIARRAQARLAEWARQLKAGTAELIQRRFDLFHVCLLKIVLLQLENPSRSKTAHKLRHWLEFMHNDLKLLLILPTSAALQFFQKGGAFKPMEKVAAPSSRLRKYIRNVAWDFVQLIWRHTFTGINSRVEGFFVPYLLTFDHGLANLYDIYPQRSCLFGNEIYPPQFFSLLDLNELILDPFPELSSVVERIFTLRADEDRKRRGPADAARLADISADLERRLATYEGRCSRN